STGFLNARAPIADRIRIRALELENAMPALHRFPGLARRILRRAPAGPAAAFDPIPAGSAQQLRDRHAEALACEVQYRRFDGIVNARMLTGQGAPAQAEDILSQQGVQCWFDLLALHTAIGLADPA